MSSCASKEERAKEKYIEACANGDFDKARNIVEKLGAEMQDDEDFDFDEHMEYVNSKEIYYLLAHTSVDNNRRIMFLYNTYDAYQLPDMDDVIEVAISQDDEILPIKLIKAGVDPTEAIVKAALNADMRDLVELCIKKDNDILDNNEVADYYIEEFGEDNYKALTSGIYENKIKNLKKALTEAKKDRPSVHSSGIIPDRDGEKYKNKELQNELNAIENYNSTLIDVFNDALAIQQYQIARDALNAMMPTIETFYVAVYQKQRVIHGITVIPGSYLIYYNYDQISELKKNLK